MTIDKKQALALGWKPDEKGKPLVFDWIQDKIIKRYGTSKHG